MLSVILLILKIIGIILLVLLGLLILLILLVLFVPIRYRVTVEHGDCFALDGGVSWLLHLLHARIHQSDNERRIWVRILGILVYDSLRPPKTKKDIGRKRSKAAHKKSKDISHETLYSQDKAKERLYNENADIKHESIKQDSIKQETIKQDSIKQESISNESARDEELKNIEIKSDEIKNQEVKNQEIKKQEIKNNIYKNEDNEEDIEEDIEEEVIGFSGKIKKLINKARAKLFGLFQGIKSRLIELLHKLRNIKNKVDLILDFIRDDINKEGFLYTYGSLKKLIKHILPRRVKSRLIFGTGDPCSTGKALGVFGLLYSIYGDNLQITPDFENKVFEGRHYAKGRIRIWTILIIVIKLLLDKRFKELKMNYQILKEAL